MLNEARLIDLKEAFRGPVGRTLFRIVEQPVERVLSVSRINRLYAESRGRYDQVNYFPTVLSVLDIEYELTDEDRDKIPTSGPLLVVANHPFGAIEGVILGDLLTRRRSDVRLMGNHLLARVPELRSWIIPVNPFGGSRATQSNIGPLKASLRWLQGQGALGVFPAGTVSHLRLHARAISDPPWHPSVAALVRLTGATVVPVFFEGRNSMMFQLAGLIHPGLRTALLPHELLRRSHSRLVVRVGRPIPAEKITRYEDDVTATGYLRFKTHMLKRRTSPVRPRFLPRAQPARTKMEPLGEPVPPEQMAAELAALPEETRLHQQGEYELYAARAKQIPAVMREIGRLREKTFREVSEGTGRSHDLDRHDQDYVHLFMWNRARAELVGSYRLGQVDELLEKSGVSALYTSSLFKFNEGFLRRMGPALELGRSFIRAEYQRKPTSLALLWRGIGEYLVRHPRYKVLFGPVSISRDYASLSRRLMVEFLAQERGDRSLAGMVKPKNPLKERLAPEENLALRAVFGPQAKDADDISALVSEIEEDNKGMPVLLRHYLRLNARLLCFNVDPAFGNCIDGLIVVDLRTTEPKVLTLLKRFMGAEGHLKYASVA
jgi:putative hemolysin